MSQAEEVSILLKFLDDYASLFITETDYIAIVKEVILEANVKADAGPQRSVTRTSTRLKKAGEFCQAYRILAGDSDHAKKIFKKYENSLFSRSPPPLTKSIHEDPLLTKFKKKCEIQCDLDHQIFDQFFKFICKSVLRQHPIRSARTFLEPKEFEDFYDRQIKTHLTSNGLRQAFFRARKQFLSVDGHQADPDDLLDSEIKLQFEALKLPNVTLPTNLSSEELRDFVSRNVKDWEEFARKLKVDEADVAHIKTEVHGTLPVTKIFISLFDFLKETYPKMTFKEFLEKVRRNIEFRTENRKFGNVFDREVVDELFEKFENDDVLRFALLAHYEELISDKLDLERQTHLFIGLKLLTVDDAHEMIFSRDQCIRKHLLTKILIEAPYTETLKILHVMDKEDAVVGQPPPAKDILDEIEKCFCNNQVYDDLRQKYENRSAVQENDPQVIADLERSLSLSPALWARDIEVFTAYLVTENYYSISNSFFLETVQKDRGGEEKTCKTLLRNLIDGGQHDLKPLADKIRQLNSTDAEPIPPFSL